MLLLAHGIGGRSDLPVPLWMAVYGAAGAVLVSFFALLLFWSEPRLGAAEAGRELPDGVRRTLDARATRAALRAVGLAAAMLALAAVWVGPDDEAVNPGPTWFYVWFWVGLAPVSVLFGPVWRLANPLRTIAAGIRFLTRRHDTPPPARLGYWPAIVSLLAFLWLELVYDHSAAPHTVAVFLTGYAIVHITAGVWYGPRWFDRGDGFEVYSTLLSHLAPVGRRDDGHLVLRNPLDGLATLRPAPGLVTTVCVLLGSTAFDGLSRTQVWKGFTTNLDRPLYLLSGTLGLSAAIGLVLGVYVMTMRLTERYVPANRATGIQARFVHSLIPVAFGYAVAHYFSFAIFQGQAGYLLAGDPFGKGWDLLGTVGQHIDYTLVSLRTIGLVQVAAIVTGHVVGVAAAHDRAVGTFARADRRTGQYPLLTAMVAYTMAGIAILVGS